MNSVWLVIPLLLSFFHDTFSTSESASLSRVSSLSVLPLNCHSLVFSFLLCILFLRCSMPFWILCFQAASIFCSAIDTWVTFLNTTDAQNKLFHFIYLFLWEQVSCKKCVEWTYSVTQFVVCRWVEHWGCICSDFIIIVKSEHKTLKPYDLVNSI